MKFVCDAPKSRTWFRLETEAEAIIESTLMRHAVEKYFRREMEAARASYQPGSTVFIEQEIGLKAHLRRRMARFLTLRDAEGDALATAMLPPEEGGRDSRCIIVGPENADPYPAHGDAIAALGQHLGANLDAARCYPYRRG